LRFAFREIEFGGISFENFFWEIKVMSFIEVFKESFEKSVWKIRTPFKNQTKHPGKLQMKNYIIIPTFNRLKNMINKIKYKAIFSQQI
jgi:hypothetical protein